LSSSTVSFIRLDFRRIARLHSAPLSIALCAEKFNERVKFSTLISLIPHRSNTAEAAVADVNVEHVFKQNKPTIHIFNATQFMMALRYQAAPCLKLKGVLWLTAPPGNSFQRGLREK